MRGKILAVIDMQNDFVTGSLGTKEAQKIIPAAVRRILECRDNGYYVYATQDTHTGDYLSTPEGKKLPVIHCVEHTKGWALQEDVDRAIMAGPHTTVNKNTFGSLRMAQDILDRCRDYDLSQEDMEIELIGLCTDICVISNALLLKAYLPCAAIRVNSACCAGVTPELHQKALDVMRSCQIEVI